MKFRVRHNYQVSQPSRLRPIFGERNEGFVIDGDNPRDAIEAWNSQQPPGGRLNPFYLEITPESSPDRS